MSHSTLTAPLPSTGVPHIGSAPHRARNLMIGLGLGALAAGIATSAILWGRHDVAAADELTRFQAVYAERCDGGTYAPPQAALARKLYLGSSVLQSAVARQLAALEAGAPCVEVYHALRAVDFPMPPGNEPSPREVTNAVPSESPNVGK